MGSSPSKSVQKTSSASTATTHDEVQKPVEEKKKSRKDVDEEFIKQFVVPNVEFEVACKNLPKLMKELRKITIVDDNATIIWILIDHYSLIANTVENVTADMQQTWMTLCLKHDYIESLQRYYKIFNTPKENFFATQNYYCFFYAWRSLFAVSDSNAGDVCKHIVKNKLLRINVELINRDDIILEVCEYN
jgi:hypothetical protein